MGAAAVEHDDSSLVQLPVVDLHSANVSREMIRAHQEWGLFQVVNHGIPGELLDAVVVACKDFFCGAQELKDEVAADAGYRKEGYNQAPGKSTFGMQLRREHLYLNLKPESRKNLNKWPASHKGLVDLLGEYSMQVSTKLLNIISEGLNLERELSDVFDGQVKQTFCAFSYPASSENCCGVPEHTDIGTLVLLFADKVPGLQVCREGEWFTIKPLPGALVVSFAEILEVLSNGKLRAPLHRVVLNPRKPRFSCAVTFEPPEAAMIGPVPQLLDENSSYQRYRSFAYKDRYAEMEAGMYLKSFAML